MPIIRPMKVLPLTRPAVRRLIVTAHGVGRHHRFTHAWPGLTLVGLAVGILPLGLQSLVVSQLSPGVPSTVVRAAIHAPQVVAFGFGASPILSPPEARQAAVVMRQEVPPDDSLAPADSDLQDDDPSSQAVLTAGDLVRPPPPSIRGTTGVTPASLWPFRYLVRPQLLTRL